MAVIELGKVTSSIVNYVNSGGPALDKVQPWSKEAKRKVIINSKPIQTAPLNTEEMCELNELRALRNAMHEGD